MAKNILKNFRGFNVIQAGLIGSIGGLLAFIVSLVFNAFDIPKFQWNNQWVDITAATVQIDLRSKILEAGLFKEAGLKFMEFLTGVFNFDAMDFLGIVIGGALIYTGGRLIYSFLKPGKFMLKLRVFFSWVIGAAAFGLIAPWLLGLPMVVTFVSLLAYGIVLGLVLQVAVNLKPLRFIRE